ncbi:MAG: branched-chain amino acid ABC transporter permease [Burkholderiaceae bacterium]|nr:branched-chain amino acid ABC transporter permease [Burkholderiaceae bacterium]
MGFLDILLSGQLLFAALVTGALYALVALGLNLVYGTMRVLNVAHGDLVMLGAYAAFYAFSMAGWSPLLAAPLIAAIGGLAGYALYTSVFRRLLDVGALNATRLEGNSLLLFFGISILVQNVAAAVFTPNNQGYQYLSEIHQLGTVSMTGNRIAALLIAGAACAAIAVFLGRSVSGLALRAVIERREAAYVVGVNVDRVQAMSFVLGFGTAALGGVLISMLEQFSPFSGFPFTIAGFIVIILGGLGNIGAGLAAALLLGAIETYGVALTSANLRSVLLYGVFVGSLLVFPRGIFRRPGRT